MANTKISQLTALTTPTGSEEFVYAYNNANGKVTLNTVKSFIGSGGAVENAYDAVVDASGNGDYLLVSAAIAAGKYNIFVKNGNYTETAGRDPYTNNVSFLRVVGESKSGVQVTFPNTITTTNKIFIDMRYGNNANFYMENISFNIALSSDNTRFYDDNGGDVMIKNCSFTYSGASNTSLFNASSLSDRPHIFNCDFVALDSNGTIIVEGDVYFEGCSFKTTSGELKFTSSDTCKLYNCNVDAHSINGVTHMYLYNTVMSVSGGTITGDLSMYHVCNSELNISSLQSTPSLIEAALVSDSIINAQGYNISFGKTYNGARCISGSYIKADTVSNAVIIEGCVLACTTFNVPSGGNVSGCRFLSPISTINIQNNAMFVGNYSGQTFTLNVTQDNSIIVGNNMGNVTLVDSGTGTVKANNIFAS